MGIYENTPLQLNFDNPYTIRQHFDGSDRLEYLCESIPGADTSKPVWRIRKFTYVGSTENIEKIEFAEGRSTFEFVADDYLSYSYS